jgi:hypothetical protein
LAGFVAACRQQWELTTTVLAKVSHDLSVFSSTTAHNAQ